MKGSVYSMRVLQAKRTTMVLVTVDLLGNHLTYGAFCQLQSWQLHQVKENGYTVDMLFTTTLASAERPINVVELYRMFTMLEEKSLVFVQSFQMLGESIQVKEEANEA